MEAHFDFEKPIATLEKKLQDLRDLASQENVNFDSEIKVLEAKLHSLIDEVFNRLTPWQRVQLSRHPNRPHALDYISMLFQDFTEIHGDRAFGDDNAIVTGFGMMEGKPYLVVAQEKGRNTKQKIERNFGMVRPEGYRKALRAMQLASQFRIPILTLIDTPGAFPGIDAEERGQSQAIANSIMEMFDLESPIVACVIGEGGSGGALALGVADRVLMQEFSTYSVISPESCASILWSDSTKHEQASQILKLTTNDLLPLKVIDGVIAEPKGGAHRDWNASAQLLKETLVKTFSTFEKKSPEKIKKSRFEKFRTLGKEALLVS